MWKAFSFTTKMVNQGLMGSYCRSNVLIRRNRETNKQKKNQTKCLSLTEGQLDSSGILFFCFKRSLISIKNISHEPLRTNTPPKTRERYWLRAGEFRIISVDSLFVKLENMCLVPLCITSPCYHAAWSAIAVVLLEKEKKKKQKLIWFQKLRSRFLFPKRGTFAESNSGSHFIGPIDCRSIYCLSSETWNR